MSLTPQQLNTWMMLTRTQQWISQQLAHDMWVEDHARITWYETLMHLYYAPVPDYGLRMQDLSDLVVLSNSGMTRLIDRLVEEGLCERHVYEENRREVYVVITDEGKQWLKGLIPRHQARVLRYFAQHVSEEEQFNLKEILERLQTANDIPTCGKTKG